jgi:hypothetical protein
VIIIVYTPRRVNYSRARYVKEILEDLFKKVHWNVRLSANAIN